MSYDINKLHPAIRKMVGDFLADAQAQGIDLRIVQGMRTFEEQDKLYNQEHDGIDNDGNGKIDDKSEHVTNAKPGQSFHNYGLAIDVCPFVNGKPDWNSKLWSKIGEIGKKHGFSWGGDWKSFKDIPHFEYPPNTKYTKLLYARNTGKIDSEGFVDLTKL